MIGRADMTPEPLTPEEAEFRARPDAALAPDEGLREALDKLLSVAFRGDDFLTQNGIPMTATPGVRRAVRKARAALASQPVPEPGLDALRAALRKGRRNRAPWEQGIDNPAEVGRAIADAALGPLRAALASQPVPFEYGGALANQQFPQPVPDREELWADLRRENEQLRQMLVERASQTEARAASAEWPADHWGSTDKPLRREEIEARHCGCPPDACEQAYLLALSQPVPQPVPAIDAPTRELMASFWVYYRCGIVGCRTVEPHDHGDGQPMREMTPEEREAAK